MDRLRLPPIRHLSLLIPFVLAGALALPAAEAARGATDREQGEKVLITTEGLDSGQLEDVLSLGGGRLLAWVPEMGLALARVRQGGAPALERDGRLRIYDRQARVEIESGALDPGARIATLVLELMAPTVDLDAPPNHPPPEDALLAPDWWDLPAPPEAEPDEGAGRPVGATWQNTSEYLAGRVSLNLLLAESWEREGPQAENWTEALETRVLAEALQTCADLVTLYPGSDLVFTVHLYSGRNDARLRVDAEPIVLPGHPGREDGAAGWIAEILAGFGFDQAPPLIASRRLADRTRIADGSDWALNVFVANAANDADGRFADGRFAWTWLGGPHSVVSSKAGGWGAARLDLVLRHELHHAFYALDQFADSACVCSDASGYLAGTNENCEVGCLTPEPDVMRDTSLAASTATRRQVGTFDADLDGTPDLLEATPEVDLQLDSPDPSCDGIVVFKGLASVGRQPNINPLNVTPRESIGLGRITRVEVRVDNGGWQRGLVYATDGDFDQGVEPFELTLALAGGRHHVEVRAIDARGNVSNPAHRAVDVAEVAQPLAGLRIDATRRGTTLSWRPSPGAASYRIRRAARPGAVDFEQPVLETAATTWSDVSPGTAFYSVTVVDGCGREVANPP